MPLLAAAPRTVTIVVEQSGAPVADARVLISADEMDAVGRTDAQGRVTVTTTSTRITVIADKGAAKGSVSGTEALLTVALTGGAQ
ncbi:MAG TPA: hypothetical protein VN851_07755 [Thermoanaerobaculia bacterium]|nr:hypothetical protein [Thermoanaerobaculia bacterium]